MALSIGQILHNRYRVVQKLGEGGFGAVYRAWDMSLNAPCALKENFETTPEAARQFAREASILANLRHPNLPRVTDHFVIPGQGQYLVMDFIEGDNLQTLLQRSGAPLPENQVLAWIIQICDALAYLHAQTPPVIHRDIKPQNIIITPDGRAVLVDFGVAKIYDPNLKTTLGARAFTPGYAPIEQYGHGVTDPRTDLYALGATAYVLLTATDLPESVQRAVHDTLIPPAQANPALSAATAAALFKALQMDPAHRFQSAAEMKAALSAPPQPQTVVQPPSPILPALTLYNNTIPPSSSLPLPVRSAKRQPPWTCVFIGLGLFGLICLLAVSLSLVYMPRLIGAASAWERPTPTMTQRPLPAPTLTPLPTAAPVVAPLRIALIAPFSGSVATFGESTRNGAQLAVEQWNAKDGVLGRPIELLLYDGQCEAEAAILAAKRAIYDDQVHYIVGEVCSKASIPISELANEAGVVQISPTSTNLGVTIYADGRVKPYTFRACFIDPFQGRVAARFAYDNLRARTAFVLVDPQNSYVVGLADAFEAAFASYGGRVIARLTYATGDTDFSPALAEIARTQPHIVYLPDFYNVASLVMTQARARQLSMPFIGGDGWDSPDLDRRAADGSYYTTHYFEGDSRPLVQEWIDLYGKTYQSNGKSLVPDAVATLAYDSVNLMLTAIQQAGVDDPAVVKDVLVAIHFEGVTGSISFDENHNPLKPAVILQIKDGEIRYVTTVTP